MDLTTIFKMRPEDLRARTERIAQRAFQRWQALAPSEVYRESLEMEVTSDTTAEIRLVGNIVFEERGTKGRNVSDALIRSSSAKIAKAGHRYISIPIGGEFRTASERGRPWIRSRKRGHRFVYLAIAEVIRQLGLRR